MWRITSPYTLSLHSSDLSFTLCCFHTQPSLDLDTIRAEAGKGKAANERWL